MTPKRRREDLETYVNVPVVTTVLYTKQDANQSDPLLFALSQAAQHYGFSQDPYVLELKEQDDPKSQKVLSKALMKRKTYCWENLRALDLRAWAMLEQLGASMSRWYINTCISRFRDGMVSEMAIMPDLSEQERKHLAEIFETVTCQDDDESSLDLAVSEKVQKLIEILRQHDQISTRGIVFVEQRVQDTAQAKLLEQVPEISHRIMTFVGTSANAKRKISVADLVDIKDQEDGMIAFREGDKNLMIATNVLEEGIDVSACNLVSILSKFEVKHELSC